MKAHRCEPPADDRQHRWHFIQIANAPDRRIRMGRWFEGVWMLTQGRELTPEEAHALGWRYMQPFLPPSAELRAGYGPEVPGRADGPHFPRYRPPSSSHRVLKAKVGEAG